MPTLEQLWDWRERLLQARFSGLREVRDSNGESVTYRSGAEIAAALAALDSELLKLGRPRPGSLVFQTSKGL